MLKIILALISLIFWISYIYYHNIFLIESTSKPNGLHVIMVSDHSLTAYITSAQNNLLNELTIFAIIAFILAIFIDIFQKK
jgi:hypothetical protein